MPAPKKKRKWLLLILFTFIISMGAVSYYLFFKPNIYLDGKKYKFIYIATRYSYEDLVEMLEDEHIFQNRESFELMARVMDLRETYKPGKYRVIAGMSNRQLINLIKTGKQEPVRLVFNSADRTEEDIINKITDKLEITPSELEALFETENPLRKEFNFNRESLRCLFLPNTYELNWNTPLPELINKVKEHYNTFWTTERKKKAGLCKLSPAEVIILSSIVQSESAVESEQKKIAGVYFNRIGKNMPLQADPTLIFALGDFTRRRVLNEDKQIDSPYNCYKNKGLPPGPICLPFTQAIDAVLNATRHNYLFFCARPQLNGYSDFSSSYEEHVKCAEAYRKEMDRRGILK